MAEVVEFRTEETIPELETMMPLLFVKEEVQDLTKTRRDYEYKLRRTPKRKEDYMRYIEFEIKLMKVVSLRHKKKGLQKNAKMANLKCALGKRLNNLFIAAIRSFPSDLRLWLTYIKFCKQMRFFPAVSRVLERMLELHGSARPELFKIAGNLELNDCNCVEKARQYLLSGIHIHKDNKMLLTEAFKLELIDTDKRRKHCLENKIEMDPRNDLFTSKKAEIVYDHSIRKLNDLELMNELLSICAEFDFTSQLEGKIESDMHRHSADERMWDILARRELNSDDKSSPKDKIKKCIALFDKGVKTLNTPRMWEFYIDTLNKINEDKQVLPNYKRKMLMSALHKGGTSGKLGQQHYLLWVKQLQGGEKHKKLVEVLQGAVKRLPESAVLWHTLLRAHVGRGEEKAAAHVFEAATKALGGQSLPLWKLMLQFEQTKRNSKVEEIYKKSWSQCPEISNALRPMHLEWLVLTAGIAVARKTYDVMCELHPPCLELHKKMIYLESIQPTLRKKRVVQCYTIACAQFGATNVDVWMDFYKFEFNNGANEKEIKRIYNRACNYLAPPLRDVFVSEFNIFQNVPKGSEKAD